MRALPSARLRGRAVSGQIRSKFHLTIRGLLLVESGAELSGLCWLSRPRASRARLVAIDCWSRRAHARNCSRALRVL
jgi:hypothetical protein